jgi:hypothetical protein
LPKDERKYSCSQPVRYKVYGNLQTRKVTQEIKKKILTRSNVQWWVGLRRPAAAWASPRI